MSTLLLKKVYDYIRFWTILVFRYRNRRIFVGIDYCRIYGILIIIGSFVTISLIPLYLPNHSVEVARSDETRMLSLTSIFHLSCFFQIILVTDIWAIEYYTDDPYVQTRAVPNQVNTSGLSHTVSQSHRILEIEKKIELFG